MKKAIALVLSFAMVCGLVACKKSETTTTSESTTQTSATTTESTTETTEEVVKPTQGDPMHDAVSEEMADGVKALDDHFDFSEDFGWGSYMESDGAFAFANKDGQMIVNISNPGTVNHACQAYRDGFPLYKGAEYQLEYDIYADIERDYEWRIQLNGGDYHAYCGEPKAHMTTQPQHMTYTFTMLEKSDSAPRFAFNFGDQGDCGGKGHKIYVDNVVLTLLNASAAEEVEPPPEPIHLAVNQVGYQPDDKKIVFVYGERDEKFEIVDVATDKTVFEGKMSDSYQCRGAQKLVAEGDFTSFKTPGTYLVRTATYGDSYKFEIKDGVYDEALKASILMLYTQRCGCEVKAVSDEYKAFTHPDCHMQTAKIYGTDKTIDVSGGWHDAGDYGRYVAPGAKAVADLLMTYQDTGYKADDLGIPESGNGVPDILDEARYELEWMLKMQDENGGVYHKVTCANFPATVMPQEETEELLVLPISTTATGDFAAVMAKASVAYKDIDADFAGKCLEAAKKAYTYMETNAAADKTGFLNPSDVFTGEYPDDKNSDEFFWAAIELNLATGEASYLDKAKELYKDSMDLGLGWIEMGLYGIHAYLRADSSIATDTEFAGKLKERVMKRAQLDLTVSKSEGYKNAMGVNYPWGSNLTICNNGMLYNLAYLLSGDEAFKDLCGYQVDYIMGMNICGYSFLTGFGEHAAEHPHHRPSQANEQAVPGMVVGGPNGTPADPFAISLLMGNPPATCYCDNDTAYSINEVAIYWNSPFIYILAAKAK